MKAAPLLVAWHDDNAPIYSAHFEPHGKGRLATGAGDNKVRVRPFSSSPPKPAADTAQIWKIEGAPEDRKVVYLSTLSRHAQAVNVVRWAPRGELLASGSDDGNVVLWVPGDAHGNPGSLGEEDLEDKETWRVKRMCRSPSESEIYDLAWSPDGAFFVTGSMDNIARIYDSQTGNMVRQIAEHNHYVQGVAWDPLNEFLATQSSDRSVHIYTLKSKDGQFSLAQHNKIAKIDLPPRRISGSSPAPPDFGGHRASFVGDGASSSYAMGSPAPSIPGTPTSLSVPMNPPPPMSHSRRSSFGSPPSIARSASPAPSLPLPAVMPSASPNLHPGLGIRNTNIYANETLTSFFRRLTFTPDGSLLLTPAGQYKTANPSTGSSKATDDVINTVYIYTRAGLNKPPIAHLPGHKKPSVAVRCSPVLYNLRPTAPTKEITIDTSATTNEEIPELPEPAVPQRPASTSFSSMEPPPLAPSPSPSVPMEPPPLAPSPSPSAPPISPKTQDGDASSIPGPLPAFALPYRIVYAVATQDSVLVYDTQQQTAICIVSNLHFATFTDLAWTNDGLTLLMTSSDGFCSALSFTAGELGTVYHGPPATQKPHHSHSLSNPSVAPAPSKKQSPSTNPGPFAVMPSQFSAPSPPPVPARPASPTRSNSASSVTTQSSFAQTPLSGLVISNPTPGFSAVPSLAAAHSAPVQGVMPMTTPPQTPLAPVLGKRGSESESGREESHGAEPKRRRIAPTLVLEPEARDAAGGGGGGGAGSGQP